MSIDKAEVKILTANEIGASLEDMLEEAQKNEHMYAGAKEALGHAYKNIGQLTEVLKNEIEEGTIKLGELREPEQIEGLVRKFIARAMNVVESMQLHAQSSQIGAAGMVAAFTKAMGVPKKVMDVERGKLEAIRAAIQAELDGKGGEDVDLTRPRARPTGVHPGNPLAERREEAKPNGKAKKKPKCGNCGKAGHNVLTCPDKKSKRGRAANS